MVTFTAISYSSADFMLYFSFLIHFASQIAEIFHLFSIELNFCPIMRIS